MNVIMVGRRWFERTNGNTYHSVKVYVDGDFLDGVDFEYGYGNAWEYTGLRLLEDHGLVPEGVTAPWQLRDHGITLVREVSDVARKRDL